MCRNWSFPLSIGYIVATLICLSSLTLGHLEAQTVTFPLPIPYRTWGEFQGKDHGNQIAVTITDAGGGGFVAQEGVGLFLPKAIVHFSATISPGTGWCITKLQIAGNQPEAFNAGQVIDDTVRSGVSNLKQEPVSKIIVKAQFGLIDPDDPDDPGVNTISGVQDVEAVVDVIDLFTDSAGTDYGTMVGAPTSATPPTLIQVDSFDTNGNGIPDFADGIDEFGNYSAGACASFQYLNLFIEGFDPTKAKIRFDYSASDPALVQRIAGSPDTYAAAPGLFRLWTKDGGQPRHVANFNLGGDYLSPGTAYSLSALQTAAGGGEGHLRLFVEAVNPSNGSTPPSISVWVDPVGNGHWLSTGGAGPTDSVAFTPFVNPSNVSKLATGNSHTLKINADGTVSATGSNLMGQLGNGSFDQENSFGFEPVLKADGTALSNIVSVAAGGGHSLAVAADGSIWSWGANWGGQLGDGTWQEQVYATPLTVVDEHGIPVSFIAVTAGANHSLAIATDGTAWAWGYNADGEVGDGTLASRPSPVRVKNHDGQSLAGVVAMAGGINFSLALNSKGGVRAWGANTSGQLGRPDPSGQIDSNLPFSAFPVSVKANASQDGDLTGVSRIAAGGSTAIAVTAADGAVWAWGSSENGKLGNVANLGTDSALPVQVQTSETGNPFLHGAQDVAMSQSHVLAVLNDGTLWSWGNNEFGELGLEGVDGDIGTATQISLSSVRAAYAGDDFSYSLQNDGIMFGWGDNSVGELGEQLYDTGDVKSPAMLANALDTDGDGIPDWWEIAVGLNPTDPSDAGLPAPGSGSGQTSGVGGAGIISYLTEYVAGVSPASVLASDKYPDDAHRTQDIPDVEYIALDLSGIAQGDNEVRDVALSDSGTAAFFFSQPSSDPDNAVNQSFAYTWDAGTLILVRTLMETDGSSELDTQRFFAPQTISSDGTLYGWYANFGYYLAHGGLPDYDPTQFTGLFAYNGTVDADVSEFHNTNGIAVATGYIYACSDNAKLVGYGETQNAGGGVSVSGADGPVASPSLYTSTGFLPSVISRLGVSAGTLNGDAALSPGITLGTLGAGTSSSPFAVNDSQEVVGSSIGGGGGGSGAFLYSGGTLLPLQELVPAAYSQQVNFSNSFDGLINNAGEIFIGGSNLEGPGTGLWFPEYFIFGINSDESRSLQLAKLPVGWQFYLRSMNNSRQIIAFGRKDGESMARAVLLYPVQLIYQKQSSDPDSFNYISQGWVGAPKLNSSIAINTLAGAAVSITSNQTGTLTPAQGTTDAAGDFATIYSTTVKNDATFSVTVNGNTVSASPHAMLPAHYQSTFSITGFYTPSEANYAGNKVTSTSEPTGRGRQRKLYHITSDVSAIEGFLQRVAVEGEGYLADGRHVVAVNHSVPGTQNPIQINSHISVDNGRPHGKYGPLVDGVSCAVTLNGPIPPNAKIYIIEDKTLRSADDRVDKIQIGGAYHVDLYCGFDEAKANSITEVGRNIVLLSY